MILQSAPVSPVTDAVHRSSRFFGDSKMIEGSMVLLRVSTSSGSGKRTRLQGTSPGPRRICDEKEGNRKRSPVLYFYDF